MWKSNMNFFLCEAKEKLSTRLNFLFSLSSKFAQACKRFWNHDNTFKSFSTTTLWSSAVWLGVRKIFIERKSVRSVAFAFRLYQQMENFPLLVDEDEQGENVFIRTYSLSTIAYRMWKGGEKRRSKKRSNLKSQIEKLSRCFFVFNLIKSEANAYHFCRFERFCQTR